MKFVTTPASILFLLVAFSVFAAAQDLSTQMEPAKGDTSYKNDPGADGTDGLISAPTYAFGALSGVPLEDMSTGTTTLLVNGGSGAPLSPIGFQARFDGGYYTTFDVSQFGYLKFGTELGGIGSSNNQLQSVGDSPKVAPYWNFQCIGSNGKVHYKVVGAPGSRKLVVEWQNMKIDPAAFPCASEPGNATYQVWFYENSGVVQFVYGPGMTSSGGTYSVGMQAGPANNFASVTTFSSSVSYTTADDSQIAGINPGKSYTFSPNVPAAPSGLTATPTQTSVQLNWTDNANNETGYLVLRTTDNVNFYFIAPALPVNTTSYTDTGLDPGTTYTFYVIAYSEGAFSSNVPIQVTTAAIGTVSSLASGGNWSAPSTWAGGVVPAAGDNVTIASGATVVIDTQAVARSVTVGDTGSREDLKQDASPEGGAPAILRFGTAEAYSLTLVRDLTIGPNDVFDSGIGEITQHALVINGDLISNGTLDFSTNSDQAGAVISFKGTSNAVFNGSGPVTDVQKIVLDKEPGASAVVELSTVNFSVKGSTTDSPGAAYLQLVRGTFKISGTFTANYRTFIYTTYQIPDGAGLWLNNPNYTVAPLAVSNFFINGNLRISQGRFNVGVGPTDSAYYRGGGEVMIEGGEVNVSGGFGASAFDGSAKSYTQTGGVVTVCRVVQSSLGGFCFYARSGPNFRTSLAGGEIIIQNPPVNNIYPAYGQSNEPLLSDNTILRLGNALTAQPGIFRIEGRAPNLVIDNSVPGHVVYSSGASAKTINITPGTTLNLNDSAFTLRGDSFINDGTIWGLYSVQDGGLFFDAPNAVYSGSGLVQGALSKIVINSGTLTLNSVNNLRTYAIYLGTGSVINANKITLGNNDNNLSRVWLSSSSTAVGHFDTAPTFDLGTGGQSIYYYQSGSPLATGNEINPTRQLVTLDVTGESIQLSGGDLTAGTIYLNNRARLDTGSFRVVNTGLLYSSYGWVNGTLVKQITTTGNYEFHVAAHEYLEPWVVVTAVGPEPAYLIVRNIDAPMPGLDPSRSLIRHWVIEQSGGSITANFGFRYYGHQANGNGANYKLWRSTGGTPAEYPTIFSTINTTHNEFTIAGTQFSGIWGVGEQLSVPVSIGGTVTTSTGNPIRSATVTISGGNLSAPITTTTGSLGTYSFSGLQSGWTYQLTASAKRYRIPVTPISVTPSGDLGNVNFVANPQE